MRCFISNLLLDVTFLIITFISGSFLLSIARRKRTSFKAVLNEAVRRGLSAQEPRASSRRRFVVDPRSSPFGPGIDAGKLNQLVDL